MDGLVLVQYLHFVASRRTFRNRKLNIEPVIMVRSYVCVYVVGWRLAYSLAMNAEAAHARVCEGGFGLVPFELHF